MGQSDPKEHRLPMIFDIPCALSTKWCLQHGLGLTQAELFAIAHVQACGNQHHTFNREAKEAAVKEEIYMRGKHQTVEPIEAFLGGLASAPGLDMTGTEKKGGRNARDAADGLDLHHVATEYAPPPPGHRLLPPSRVVE